MNYLFLAMVLFSVHTSTVDSTFARKFCLPSDPRPNAGRFVVSAPNIAPLEAFGARCCSVVGMPSHVAVFAVCISNASRCPDDPVATEPECQADYCRHPYRKTGKLSNPAADGHILRFGWRPGLNCTCTRCSITLSGWIAKRRPAFVR